MLKAASKNQPGDFRLSSARSVFGTHVFPAVLVAAGLLSIGFVGCHPAPSPEVLATVNGKQIVQSDVDRLYKQSLGESAQAPSKEEASIQRLQILKTLIEDEILQQRAAKLNLVATDEEVDAKLTDM